MYLLHNKENGDASIKYTKFEWHFSTNIKGSRIWKDWESIKANM
jgi:hypothetical protein